MNLTRRGLFGFVGRVVAAAGLAKVVAAMPPVAAAAPVATVPFAGSFVSGTVFSSTQSITTTMSVYMRGLYDQSFAGERWTSTPPRPYVPRFAYEVERDPLRRRVMRNVQFSKEVRRSHPASRRFWGLP